MQLNLLRLAGALSLLVLCAQPARTAVFIVASSDDSSDADLTDPRCADASSVCTLRAAIEQANASAGPDSVEFAIPAPIAPIALFSTLTISDALTIDGYSQSGSSENTLAVGTNAVIPIAIEGAFPNMLDGIRVQSPSVALSGLTIRGFVQCVHYVGVAPFSVTGSRLSGSRIESCGLVGIWIQGGSAVRIGGPAAWERNLIATNETGIYDDGTSNFIVNNSVGTDESGRQPRRNLTGILLRNRGTAVTDNLISGNDSGVVVQGSNSTLVRNRIGTTADGTAALPNAVGVSVEFTPIGANNWVGAPAAAMAQANLVSGNDIGIRLRGPGGGNRVQGNFIGTGPSGVGAVPNRIGIEVVGSSDNVIGSPSGVTPSTEGNRIAHNTQSGISLPPFPGNPFASLQNSIRANRVFDQPFDIDLGADSATNDDPGDVDVGPNSLLNPPRIQIATAIQGNTQLSGVIDAAAGTYRLDFYSASTCDASPDTGRAELYLGSASLTAAPTAGNPLTAFNVNLPVTAQGQGFTATATNALGSTSELGPCAIGAVSGVADLAVTLGSVAPSFDPGDPVTLRVQLQNQGPFAASNIQVLIPPPPAIGAWTNPGFSAGGNTWGVLSLASGASATLDLTGTIAASATGLMSFNANADQALRELDPNLNDNRASASSVVRAGADLRVTITPAAQGAANGETADFDIDVTNLGPDPAQAVQLTGELDFQLGLDVATAPNGLAFDPATRRWSFTVGSLAEGEVRSIHLRAFASSQTTSPFGLRHVVSVRGLAGARPADPDLATAVVGVPLAADLAIENLHWPSGGSIDWTAAVVNHGPDEIPDIAVSDIGSATVISVGTLAPGQTFFIQGRGITSELGIETGQYYETQPASNHVFGKRGVASSCGLLGIEAPIFLGFVAASAGRRGRRLRRLLRLRGGSRVAIAALLGTTMPDPARASTLTLTVDSAASSATLTLATPLGSTAPAPVTLSGSASIDVTLATDALFGLHAASVQLGGGAIALSDASILLESFPLYSLTFASNGLVVDPSGGSASGFAVAPGLSLFDLAGSTLRFGAGSVGASGSYFGLPVNQSIDLASLPFTAFFPLGSVAEARVVDLGGGQASLELRLPFSALLTLAVDDTQSTLTFAGTLVLAGSVVPEPDRVGLLVFAAAALALGSRRLRAH